MEDKKVTTRQIKVKVPEGKAAGVYANIVHMNAGNNEVVLDFILAVPNPGEEAILASRVVVSTTTAQQMSDILEALLRQREKLAKERGT